MSEQLKAFFEDYLEWAETGEKHEVFSCRVGLCNNFEYYLAVLGMLDGDITYEVLAMKKLWIRDGLEELFPFESSKEYMLNDDLHKNPKRIAWVRKQLGK